MDDLSVNFHEKFFFILAKNEEKTCHGNLRMSCPWSTYGSISEPGEFSLNLDFFVYRFDLWKMLSPLCYFFLIIAIQVNANPIPAVSNTTENEFEVCNASEITYKKCYIFSWLTQWQNCFSNDPSEDVGHFFLTRLINCWPTTPSM